MSPFQMEQARECVAGLYPLDMPRGASCNAYSSRRALVDISQLMRPAITETEGKAFGNLADQLDMASPYNAQKAQLVFIIKAKLFRIIRATAEAVGQRDVQGAWNVSWGDIPIHVIDVSDIHAHVVSESADIIPETQEPEISIRLTAIFSAAGGLGLVAPVRDWETE